MQGRSWARGIERAGAAGAALLLVSCGGSMRMDPRYVAVHNALAVMGLAQTGEINQGSLAEGTEARVRVAMRAGDCYTVLGLGGDGVEDLDVSVRDAAGNELVSDRTDDAEASAQFCPPRAGEYEVVVRAERGSGEFLVSAWSGGRSGGGDFGGGGTIPTVARRGGAGSCEQPTPLTLGTSARGDTTGGDRAIAGSCIEGGDAPEQVYSFTIEQRAMVSAVMTSTFDGALYLLGACGDPRSEIACNDDAPSTTRSEVSATLEPGTYFLVVDGYGDASGQYEVVVNAAAMQSLAQICGGAPTLVPGTPVAAATTGQPSYFQASCAQQAQSGDRVYALDVTQRSRLRVRMQSTFDGAIHIRRDCDDLASEIGCNDDYGDARHSLVTTTVDPGRYYVIADGFGIGQSGDYSLLAELGSAAGGGPADTCAAPGTFTPGQPLGADTFSAADDLAGTCGGQGAPDVVYRLDVRSRTRLRATFADSEIQPVVAYLQRTCGSQTGEVFCQEAGPTAPVDQVVQPGTYFFVIDGGNPDAFGSAAVSLQLDDLGALDQACRGAPMIRPGRQVAGDTTGSTDRFQATCAGSTQSPDVVYRLQLRRRQRVRISSEQTDFDGAIYVRRDCTDGGTEVACNDDAGDNRHSLIEATLDAGTYFVFVDGYGSGQQGRFTLDVDLSSP